MKSTPENTKESKGARLDKLLTQAEAGMAEMKEIMRRNKATKLSQLPKEEYQRWMELSRQDNALAIMMHAVVTEKP